jgi:hypothetical protein
VSQAVCQIEAGEKEYLLLLRVEVEASYYF